MSLPLVLTAESLRGQYQTPDLRIEGRPYRSNTIPPPSRKSTSKAESSNHGLPDILEDDDTGLAQLLREYKVDGNDGDFWPEKLLRHILSRDRVLAELNTYNDPGNTETYLKYILPDDDTLLQKPATYLVTFALLLLYGRGNEIAKFIEEELSDQNLPVCQYTGVRRGQVHLCRHDLPDRPLQCFRNWLPHEMEGFERDQWQLLVPYFELDGYTARHYKLRDKTILPWLKKLDHSQSSKNPSREEGGYGIVACVKIHPSSHGFHDILGAIRLKDDRFALKKLHDISSNNEAQFENEMEQLKRFNGLAHDHLVTLLACFTHKEGKHFLFPYAEGNLEQYWDVQNPSRDLATIQWFSKQCSGIMAAINIIHEPKRTKSLKEVKFGRHGDIKPDNILWFLSSDDPKGIFVISDLGLSSFNKDTSRSNIPNTKIIGAPPGFRPPECDLDGGTISRAFDIWTLGCLYLEMLTWLLGGMKLLEEFRDVRSTEYYITGAKNDIFFNLKSVKGQKGYVVQVKPQVTMWFDRLHNHKNCTNFIHDILNIVEEEMIIVLSKDKTRASSVKLRPKFEEIQRRCMVDDNKDNYCLRSTPRPTPPFRAATAVEANLTDIAKSTIVEHHPDLPTHDPTHGIRKSMRSDQLANMDNCGLIYAEPGDLR